MLLSLTRHIFLWNLTLMPFQLNERIATRKPTNKPPRCAKGIPIPTHLCIHTQISRCHSAFWPHSAQFTYASHCTLPACVAKIQIFQLFCFDFLLLSASRNSFRCCFRSPRFIYFGNCYFYPRVRSLDIPSSAACALAARFPLVC